MRLGFSYFKLIINNFVCERSFVQPNNYRPSPLDLSQMHLNDRMMELVDLLAENTHNVWAKDRIKLGWTYGLNEVGGSYWDLELL